MEFVTPPPAEPGDRVAVIAPSSGAAAAAPGVLELALERLRSLGVEPVVHPTARQSDDYLRAHPEARAAAVHEAFRDPDTAAVFATIGGDDQLRVLRHLDPTTLRNTPTRFFGMSDNTHLALTLWREGVVSYYGGQLLNQVGTPGHYHDYSERYLRRALFEPAVGELAPAPEWTDDVVDWGDPDYRNRRPAYDDSAGWRWHGEEPVEGRVWGGCLAVVEVQLMTDRYLPDPSRLDGAVLALETSERLPPPGTVRRTLTCLGERGLLERFDGLLVGRPQTRNRFQDRDDGERARYRRDQREAVLEAFRRYNGGTAVFDVDFGHTNPTVPLPVGGTVRLDPPEGRVVFIG